ncbi:MAG: hypothetical protein JW931_09125 [Methanomicrobiaceae archaeon]|nr:hypothetical protein [Methanomicrobiaceae archaeon]
MSGPGDNSLAGYEITEHTWLLGDDGPFTKVYDTRIWVMGNDVVDWKGITRSEMQRYLEKYKGDVE